LAEQALLDGTVEVLWAGPMWVMKHHDMNPASTLACFAEVVCRDPFSIVGRYPNPGFRFADLAHLRIATISEVPTHWLCLLCGRPGSTRRGSIASPIAAWPKTSMP